MKITSASTLACILLSSLCLSASQAETSAYAQILKERDRVLSQIVSEQEGRRSTGHAVEEEIFSAQIKLYSFRRDTAPTVPEKMRQQQLIVAAHEKQLADIKGKSKMGVVANVDVLRVTDGLLQAKQVLEELRGRETSG